MSCHLLHCNSLEAFLYRNNTDNIVETKSDHRIFVCYKYCLGCSSVHFLSTKTLQERVAHFEFTPQIADDVAASNAPDAIWEAKEGGRETLSCADGAITSEHKRSELGNCNNDHGKLTNGLGSTVKNGIAWPTKLDQECEVVELQRDHGVLCLRRAQLREGVCVFVAGLQCSCEHDALLWQSARVLYDVLHSPDLFLYVVVHAPVAELDGKG